ncbi:uroporphyrinogen-III C-methyltransferase [Pelagibacterium halotolerans]|uniref:uroporphyrinogen-III C-methyltransferase n=1 Tax=Pelagibacterium halotolerans (strain DSM 22347 / JCM 15775 / CGMCC 1.7692 / B2) TaxID=1082931 RepID=G4REJ1_PELHB|nr:uroporphyrinogen-III methyltransferase [Pelagibacterium halotolerans B2]SEA46674.1 uroporphyrinogen-III C-methyltransferase [Pelagibacterium halotolerans]
MFGWFRRKSVEKGHFAALDSARFPDFAPGSVWLVGAGPGAPGLLTLLGYHALGRADIIVYDALVSPALLDMANPRAEKIYAGKRGGKPSPKQADITLKLVEHARSGKRVLRLKGGDPMMFGRGGEEVQTLARENIPFRIVPGITAGIGGLAYAGIPVTHRDTNHTVIFLTGHDEKGGIPQGVDWPAIATASPVIVMYMAVKHLPSIAEKLIAAGRDGSDRLAIVSNAALPDQSVLETTLGRAGDLADAAVPTPAIIVLGPVSRYRETFDWYAGPLRENTIG